MRVTSAVLALAALASSAFVAAAPGRVADHRYHSVVVFGDSLSDNGNVFRLTNHGWPADPAYWRGRFSNRQVWVEYLAKAVSHFKPGADLLDLAYGGATTNNTRTQGLTGYNSTIPVPSTLDQVHTYLKSASTRNIDRSLVVVTGGANDAFFGLGGAIPPDELARLAAADLLTASRRLYEAGARHFLIPGVPGLSSIPFTNDFAQAYAGNLDSYTEAFRSYLKKHLRRAAGKDATVIFFDQAAALRAYIAKKSELPGWNVRDACLQGVYPGEAPTRSLCSDPERHVFHDIYHPNTLTHRYLAHKALEAIASSVLDKYSDHSFSLKIKT